jgi:ParB-like chromosome segregation protein Spo0J
MGRNSVKSSEPFSVDEAITIWRPQMVKLADLAANDYNPNRMPSTEMQLLEQCMRKFGFLFPLIVCWDERIGKYRIVDGYHRFEALKRMGVTRASAVVLDLPYHEAVQLTVLMNRIKGMHQVEGMSDLIVKLEDLGVADEEICENLGMEVEEYLRLKQQLGIAHAFRDHEYGNSWEEER